ncbi:Multicopper oxidase [Theobroma cacao]|nr:Multicopper oxidase [Theobroma cacao]
MITPGQSMDVLLEANQSPGNYFIAAKAYADAVGAGFDKTIATAFLQCQGSNYSSGSPLPNLPPYNRTQAATDFTKQFRSLTSKRHPAKVPLEVDTHLLYTISVNLLDCSTEKPCTGPFGKRFSASLNNISFITPKIDILQAYYYGIKGVFEEDFPRKPPHESITLVFVLEYNSSVELILQGTNVLASDNHPVHLHGYSFYVVGRGFGNFNPNKDPLKYNLVDPPQETTVGVHKNRWLAIRFRVDNPGVWLLHCHTERHKSWGMSMLFLVKNGATPQSRIFRPPHDLPTCWGQQINKEH